MLTDDNRGTKMSKKLSLLMALVAVSGTAVAGAPQDHCTDFSRYTVDAAANGTRAKPDFASTPDAQGLESTILERYTGKPNFAGHYQVVSWGCGTGCQVFAVVDTVTGKITFAPRSTQQGASFHLDSALFILDPPRETPDHFAYYETDAYVWDEAQGNFRAMSECHREHEPDRDG